METAALGISGEMVRVWASASLVLRCLALGSQCRRSSYQELSLYFLLLLSLLFLPLALFKNSDWTCGGMILFLFPRWKERKTFENPEAFPPALKWMSWEMCDKNFFLESVIKQFKGNT